MSENNTKLPKKGALSAQSIQNFDLSKPEETVQDLLNRGASNATIAHHMIKNMSQEEALEFDTLYKSLVSRQQTAVTNKKPKAAPTKAL